MPPVGVMIEVPSAVYQVRELAQHIDFVSIGTNDLTQYLLAVDRNNPKVARLYDSLHPAVLRALRTVARVARRYGKPVSVCGEMAGDPAMVPLLLGLGMDELSVSASLVPRVKRAVQSLSVPECQALVNEALELETPTEILARCAEIAQSHYGDLIA